MILDPATIKAMRGEQALEHVRTQLVEEAARIRGLEEAMARLGRGPYAGRLAAVAALEAAADVMTAIVAEGQDNRERRKNPPAWARAERDRARWEDLRSETDRLIRVLADQARASLTVSLEPPEQGKAREDADDDGDAGLGEGAGDGEAGVVGAA